MHEAVDDAREFALRAHGDQKYGSHPYAFHLDAVAELAAPFGAEAQIVGYLHDLVEDTEVSLDEIRDHFGDSAAKLVALLTDEQGINRRERKAKTNAKLAKVGLEGGLALIVKAADRLANLRASARDSEGAKLEM